MIRVGIVTNPFDPSTWEEHETGDVRQLLVETFAAWPSTARIYDLKGFGDWKRAAALTDPAVLAARDVTPTDPAGVDHLATLSGPLLVTVPPADPLTAIIAVVAVAVGVAAAFLLMPKLPTAGRQPSPNNSLSERTNQARPNQRIPDIFGTVEATPDLLMVPYTVFENNQEVEVAFMGVGRGSYVVTRVRDGDTAIASIAGASAAIYGPGTSPNSGDAPQLQIGPAIPETVQSVIKLNEVNGQTLRPTNLNQVQGDESIRFVFPDKIESNDTETDFTEYFADGDAIAVQRAAIDGRVGSIQDTADARYTSSGIIQFNGYDPRSSFGDATSITIANAGYVGSNGLGGTLFVDLSGTYQVAAVSPNSITLVDPEGINSDWDKLDEYASGRTEYRSGIFSRSILESGINLNGNYTIASVTSSSIILNNSALVNTSWNNLADLDEGATDYVSPNISRNSESWAGPYIVDLDEASEILANIIGPNGLFTLSKKSGKQKALKVGVVLEVTPVNQNDSAIGPAELFPAELVGDDTERTTIGLSLYASPSFSGRSSLRMRRTTPTPNDDDYGSVVDEIKWRDAYGLAPVEQRHFGDVTTVMTRTVATSGALSIKNRKLNMRVTRKLPARIGDADFGPSVATNNAADIMAAMALDPFIGRRMASEVDFGSLYDTIAEVAEYFGSPLAAHFGFTFDDTDVSFEETIQTVAQAVFCRAYRQGRVLRLAFERATDQSSLIFNSRNIIPGSQKRTVRFGPLDDHDGVELDWTDPDDGAAQTYKIPTNRTATSPKSLDVAGVRSFELAYWQAWRAWNKVRFQNIAIEQEATQEAALVIPNDRVLIADRVRPAVLQGEVTNSAGTVLTISEPTDLDPEQDWTIFIQHVDATVEALGVRQGNRRDQVILSATPRMQLSIDADYFARATYMIVPDDDVQTRAFLVTEREPNSNFTETVRAVNYTFLYYQHDELILWLDFGDTLFLDSGPYQADGAPVGGVAIVADSQRGRVASGPGEGGSVTLSPFAPPASYTKAAWIKRDAPAGAMSILGSADEVFGFNGANLVGGHAAPISAPWPSDGLWHHAAIAFDAPSGEVTLFVDGRPVARTIAAQRALSQLKALDQFAGRADDIRLWRRALSAAEMKAVYLGSKQAA